MNIKKKLGIVGGMGSVAAVYFFQRLVELTPAKIDQDYIETFIHNNTAIPDRTRGILYGEASPLPELKRSVSILNKMGADYIVFACMTSHYFIPGLQEESQAILIDGIAESVEYIKKKTDIKKVGILASTGAVKTEIFQKQLEEAGIEPILLNDMDQETYFMEPIYAEWGIKAGNIHGEPKKRFERAVDILIDSGAEAIIAGCSEVPLVLNNDNVRVPLVDTIDILLCAAIDKCLKMETETRKEGLSA